MTELRFDLNGNETDELEREGFELRAKIAPDDHSDAPWDAEDGHGPVTDWTNRAKAPGELVLSEDRGSFRYYDFAEACRIAQRDGWNAEPYKVPGETPKQRAAKAATADYNRLRGWCNDSWRYVGVVVSAYRNGVKLATESLWGIESDAGEYLSEVAEDLAAEALSNAKAKITELAA
jgi:hypothetical protein